MLIDKQYASLRACHCAGPLYTGGLGCTEDPDDPMPIEPDPDDGDSQVGEEDQSAAR